MKIEQVPRLKFHIKNGVDDDDEVDGDQVTKLLRESQIKSKATGSIIHFFPLLKPISLSRRKIFDGTRRFNYLRITLQFQ